MHPWRAAALGLVAALSVASVGAREPQDEEIALRVPKGERVAFRGIVPGETASGPGAQFLYPAPSAGGFLASVLTHALIVGSAQESAKSRQQESANAVLAPYRSFLDSFSHVELLQRAAARMRSPGAKRLLAPSDGVAEQWIVESAPIFSMTQDQAALVVDNAVAVFEKRGGEGPTHQFVVRVVSDPLQTEDPAAHWSVGEGDGIKEATARLMAASLDVAVSAAKTQAAKGTGVQKTVRYYEGRTEKMERGELLSEGCGRRLLRNLRGWLMSVPAPDVQGDAGACGDAPAKAGPQAEK